jgi:predicted amidohydrolase
MTPFGFLLAVATVQTPSAGVRPYVAVSAPSVALTHIRVVDGSGAAAAEDQTIVIRDGTIASIGPSAGASIPAGAEVRDLTGRTVLPGLVMVHEHYFYPAGNGMYTEQGWSFPNPRGTGCIPSRGGAFRSSIWRAA